MEGRFCGENDELRHRILQLGVLEEVGAIFWSPEISYSPDIAWHSREIADLYKRQ